MKKIKIEYNSWLIHHVTYSTIPERWAELTPKQFLGVLRLWMGTISDEHVMSLLFGLKRTVIRKMDSYQRWYLAEQVKWIQNLKNPHNAFFIEILPGTKMHSPGPRLKGCSLQQFMTADTFFQRYANNEKDTDSLNMFVASLYLKDNEYFNVNECRVPSLKKKAKEVNMDENLKVVENLSTETKYAIFMNFVLIRSWLSKAYPFLFPAADEDDDEPKVTNKQQKQKPTDWLAIFDVFVGTDVSSMETYKIMPATDAFRILNRRIKQGNQE